MNNRYSYRRIIEGRGAVASGLIGACVLGGVAYAQDLPSGLIARFDFEQRLEYSDNPDFEADGDPDLFGRTRLGFALESVTSISRLAFNLGADVEEFRQGQSTLEVTRPFLGLSYDRATQNALIGFDLRYSESDVNTPIDDRDFDQDGNVINQRDGTRQSYGFTLESAVGQEAPIGASFLWTYNEINFLDSTDPDLTDSTLNDFAGQVDFRIDPRITASLTAKYIDFDTTDNGVSRETIGFGGAVSLDVDQINRIDASLSYDNIERSGAQTGTDKGFSGGIDWVRDTPNGAIGLGYRSDVTTNFDGRRSTLRGFYDTALPRGDLSLGLGVTGADTVGTDPLADITYNLRSPTSVFSLSLVQRVTIDNNNNERINASLRASYDHQINSLSSFGASFGLFGVNDLVFDLDDGQRAEINLTYRYDLTADWGLVSGYRYLLSTEEGARDRSSNTVYVGLARSFNWSP